MVKTVTYSPAYTLVPTYECFNRCDYCNFRREPGEDEWMSLARPGTGDFAVVAGRGGAPGDGDSDS